MRVLLMASSALYAMVTSGVAARSVSHDCGSSDAAPSEKPAVEESLRARIMRMDRERKEWRRAEAARRSAAGQIRQ